MSASSSFLRLILSFRPSASLLAAVIFACICSPDISADIFTDQGVYRHQARRECLLCDFVQNRYPCNRCLRKLQGWRQGSRERSAVEVVAHPRFKLSKVSSNGFKGLRQPQDLSLSRCSTFSNQQARSEVYGRCAEQGPGRQEGDRRESGLQLRFLDPA